MKTRLILICALAFLMGPFAIGANGPPLLTGTPVGLVGWVHTQRGEAIGIDVEGDYAYLGDWGHYAKGVLNVVDVSNPLSPSLDATATMPNNEIGDVAVVGTKAYLANDFSGLTIYNLAISPPTFVSSGGGFTHSVFYEGGKYAYCHYAYGSPRMTLRDVTVYPYGITTYVPSYAKGPLYDQFVAGNRAYILTVENTNSWLEIVDVSTPTSPSYVGHLSLLNATYGAEGEVRVQGDYAYLAHAQARGGPGGLRIVDISTETSPVLVGSVDIPNAGNIGWKGIGLAVDGGCAYVAARGGLHAFDVTDPTKPTLMRTFAVPSAFGNAIGARVEVREHLAYMSCHTVTAGNKGGLAIYKLYEPVVPLDIKPGSETNPVNPKSKGLLPVAILTTDDFDAADVNAATVVLGPDGCGCVKSKLQDVDEDGDFDLMMWFKTADLGVTQGDTECDVACVTHHGRELAGSDSIKVVGK